MPVLAVAPQLLIIAPLYACGVSLKMSGFPRFPRRWLAGLALAVTSALVHAADTWPLPPAGSQLIGETRIEYAKQEDTFIDIAQRNGLGYDEIVAAKIGRASCRERV